MPHPGTLGGRTRRHAPLFGHRPAARGRARGSFHRLLRPARRAGERTASFVLLGAFAALAIVGVAIVLLARVVRPG